LLIIGFAVFVLLVIIGLAIDLGLMYVERIQLGRACDAAALAGAQELPFEEFAVKRAIQYLTENGYDPSNTELVVMGPANAGALSWPAPAGSRGTITIDTESYENDDTGDRDNSADKIRVQGRVNVPMNFMLLIGFDQVPVEAQAIAENVSNLDIVIVYDKSGSMNDDTYCYGENPTNTAQPKPCYSKDPGDEYPEGERLYLPYDASFCGGETPVTYNGSQILVAEAEYFSYSTSYGQHDYHRDNYVKPNTFWMLQRTKDSQASGYRHTKDDERGAHMMHQPHLGEIDGHKNVTAKSPRLDYDFDIPSAGTWYVWIRAQCGSFQGSGSRADGCIVHAGTDNNVKWHTSYSNFGRRGGYEAGSDGYRWRWVRLGSVSFSKGGHQVNVWGGGTGFRLDKVVVSNNPEGPDGRYDDRAPSFIRNTTPSWNSQRDSAYQTYVRNRRYGGPADTKGRKGMACHECNPIYGLRVTKDMNGNGKIDKDETCDNTLDDIFDDYQPIRSAQEAAKNFVRRLKARFDQVGFVEYSDAGQISRELNCILTPARGQDRMPDGPEGVWDWETMTPDLAWLWCYDHRTGPAGLTGGPSPDITHGSIIGAIDSMFAQGWTNIAEGMQKGMLTLTTETGHYGRPNAAKFMVVLTDGQANRYPDFQDGTCAHQCCVDDLWPDNTGDVNQNNARDCVIYFADQARNRNISIFTIGLGVNADHALMQEVADRTGGEYYFAPRGKDLDRIFQEIADKIFLRLVE
jgi:Mg-chelatase subunit ChlD